MEATKPEVLAENLARLESLLAVSNAAIEHLYSQLQKHDETDDPFDSFSLVGCSDAASGLLEIFSDMLCIVRGTQKECIQ